MSNETLQYEQFTGFSPASTLGPYRAADFWKLPEGKPVELVRGRLIMSPSPLPLHQTVSLLFSSWLVDVVRQSGGYASAAPMDVILSEDTILQPDLLYIAKERRHLVRNRVEGPPDLVIEIFSESTRRYDRLEKLDLYARHGVAEYWMVDPKAQLIEFLLLENGKYTVWPCKQDRYQSPRLPELKIQLVEFWQEVQERMPSQP